jgi:hypothetical protein
MFAHVFKSYASQAQRNLMEGMRHGWHPEGVKSIPSKVTDEFHDKSKGHMRNRDLPRRVRHVKPAK